MSLDPNLVDAAQGRVINSVESGRLNEAYDQARELLKRRPDSGIAHFTLAYVYTYGGLLEDAARECDAALALDSSNYGFRSCGLTFMELGKYERALDFFRLDAGANFAIGNEARVLLHQGKPDEALKMMKSSNPIAPVKNAGMLAAFLDHQPASEIAALASQQEAWVMADRDPENKYLFAAYDAYCGQHEMALRTLRRAVEQNYCAVPAMDNDPLFASIRNMPEFAAIRTAGIECQRKFKEHIAGHDAK
jgi:tetratricopeptide (TPR) repeat protein